MAVSSIGARLLSSDLLQARVSCHPGHHNPNPMPSPFEVPWEDRQHEATVRGRLSETAVDLLPSLSAPTCPSCAPASVLMVPVPMG
jgi:hypothetical protein